MKITIMLEGVPAVVGNLRQLTRSVVREGKTNAWNGAQHLYARTRAVVPFMDGVLYEAAFIEKLRDDDKHPMWVVGYDTGAAPYALPVHEIPDRNHPTRGPSPEPKQDHFLSEPRDKMVKTFPQDVAKGMADAIKSSPVKLSPSRRRR